jgi:outer membrane protein TolC
MVNAAPPAALSPLPRPHRTRRLRTPAFLAALFLTAAAAPALPADDVPVQRRLSLDDAIAISRDSSPSALAARHRYRGSYWQFVTYKADGLPSLDLNTTPASVLRSITRQTLPDGREAYVSQSVGTSYASLSLNKLIGFTGGRISVSTELERIEGLEGDRYVSFLAHPISVSYQQPLFAHNPRKWANRIEPRRWAEARQQYIEDLEAISANTINYFFDLLTAQTTLADATHDDVLTDSVYAAAKRRVEEGRAPEIEALQAQLAHLNANLRLTRARLDAATRQQRLANHLGLREDATFDLVPAVAVPRARVDVATAVDQARRNRPYAMSFERQLIEADRSVSEAHATNGLTSLYASYGLNQTAPELDLVYRNPQKDQQAFLKIDIPVLDWGREKARIAVAESNREVVRRQVEQSRSDFEQDVFLRVSQFQIQARQLEIASLADSVGQRRYRLARERYMDGHLDLNSVQIAQNEKDNARRAYLDALRSYWWAYIDVRRATLYDFERRTPLTVAVDGR